jgi:hypothetical protein
VKEKLHKHLPISKAVQMIVEKTADLGYKYDARVNRDRRSLPRLLDRKAFAISRDKITGYALEKAMQEWSATKRMADEIEEGGEPQFEPSKECQFGYELPLRFGLPCRH